MYKDEDLDRVIVLFEEKFFNDKNTDINFSDSEVRQSMVSEKRYYKRNCNVLNQTIVREIYCCC